MKNILWKAFQLKTNPEESKLIPNIYSQLNVNPTRNEKSSAIPNPFGLKSADWNWFSDPIQSIFWKSLDWYNKNPPGQQFGNSSYLPDRHLKHMCVFSFSFFCNWTKFVSYYHYIVKVIVQCCYIWLLSVRTKYKMPNYSRHILYLSFMCVIWKLCINTSAYIRKTTVFNL